MFPRPLRRWRSSTVSRTWAREYSCPNSLAETVWLSSRHNWRVSRTGRSEGCLNGVHDDRQSSMPTVYRSKQWTESHKTSCRLLLPTRRDGLWQRPKHMAECPTVNRTIEHNGLLMATFCSWKNPSRIVVDKDQGSEIEIKPVSMRFNVLAFHFVWGNDFRAVLGERTKRQGRKLVMKWVRSERQCLVMRLS